MKTLYRNEYLQVNIDDQNEILEVIGKKMCDDIMTLKQLLLIIEQYVKDTGLPKVIFKLEGFNTVGNERLIQEELYPYLGNLGVKHIAVITGTEKKTQIFFEELGNSLSSVTDQYNIKSKQFETRADGLKWMLEEY
jgi:hypothetical protein